MSEYTATVILKGDATQLTQALDQANQKIQQSGEQTQNAAAKFNTFSQSMVGMVGGFTAVSGGILGMVEQYTSLEKAQTVAQRSADRLNQARITEQQLQDKVNQMQAKGLTGTEAYNLALQKLQLQHSKVQTAEETATIAQQRANEAMAQFATQIVPQALSVMGGLASAISSAPGLWSKLQGSIGGAGGGLSSFITGPVGIALIGIGALATVLTLVATNAFGFRDALNAAGKAIGDAVPFLQPLLIAIKALGEQVGLTGNDTKQGFNGMNEDVKNFVTESGDNLTRWVQQVNALGTDLRTENYQKFWTDLGKMMADNSASNVKGMQQMWAAMLVDFNNFVDGLNKGLHALGGVVTAGFQLAFGGLASWFETNVVSPLSKDWDALIAKLSAPLPKLPASLTAPTGPGPETVVPPIWAPGGGLIPAAKPPPPPPTITGAGGGGAGAGAVATAAVAPATLAFTAGTTAALGYSAAIDTVAAASLHALPTQGALAKSLTNTQIETNKSYNEALKFAQVHNMVIPAAAAKSEESLIAYVNAHKDYQLELDKVNASNQKLQQQITATSERLTTGRAAQEDYTAGVLEQEAALQAMQEAHLKSAGSLATLGAQIKSGTILNAAYTQGVDEQYKALLDSTVAVSKTAGAQAELDRELATGAPQLVAYAQGVQEAHGALQQMATDTAKITGQVAEMDNELASGKLQLAAYNQGLAQGALDFDNFVKGLAGGIGQSQEMNFRLAEMAKQYGALPPGMDLTNENLNKFITLSANVAAGLPGAVGELQKFKDGFDAIAQGIQPAIDKVAKAFETLDKSVKKPLADIPKEVRNALSPEALNAILEPAKMEGLGNSYGGMFSAGFIASLKTGGEQAAAAYLQGFKVKDPEQKAEIDKITGYLAQGTQQATIAAAKALDTLGPKGKEMAAALIQSWNSQHPGETISSDLVAQVSKTEPFSAAGAAAGKAYATAFIGPIKQLSGSLSGAVQGTAQAGAAGRAAGAIDLKPTTGAAPLIDTTAAQTALKALQATAQAVFSSMRVMAAGAAAGINTEIAKGANDAAGSLNSLVSQAQADFNNIAAMPPGVAASMNSNFASGANDAAGSLNQLTSQAQADMNNMAKMPTGVATAMNTQFNAGANDAAGALNNLQNKAQGVMNNIRAAALSAAAAVRSIGTAVASLPSSKTISITITGGALAAIHSIQSAVDSLHGKSISVNVGLTGPGVGFLQHGYHGVVTSPHLFMIGEAGPERVDVSPVASGSPASVPTFDRTVNLIPSLQGGGSGAGAGVGGSPLGAGSGKEVTIIVNLGGKEIWREVRKNIFEDISQF